MCMFGLNFNKGRVALFGFIEVLSFDSVISDHVTIHSELVTSGTLVDDKSTR